MTTLQNITRHAVVTGRSSIASKSELRAAAATAIATVSYTAKSAAVRAARKAIGKPDGKEGADFLIETHKAGARESFTWARLAMPATTDVTGIAAEAAAFDPDAPPFLDRTTPENETKAVSARERRAEELRRKHAEEAARPKPEKVQADPRISGKPIKAPSKEPPSKPAPARENDRGGKEGGRMTSKFREMLTRAEAGHMPEAPDFSAATHARFRPKLDTLIALAKAGDVAGLKAVEINPISTSPKAMDRYRNFCVIALEAKASKKGK